jgi:Fur family transcriptional regulator, ferric uptake regulator
VIMKHIHHIEKEHFKKLFKQEHIDKFEERYRILEIFLQTEKHLTIQEVNGLLTGQGFDYPTDFVKNTLQMMCRFGFAHKRKFNDGQVRYEHRHLGQHHDHMICTKCGAIIEFNNEELEELQFKIAGKHGFHMLQHKMEIYGICLECLAHRAQMISLAKAKPGERLIVSDFVGGKGSHMRLTSMGLRIGDHIEVITNNNQGQLVIALDYNRYSIGHGMAQKILVQPEKTIAGNPAAG